MVYTCELCKGNYECLKGLRIYQLSCKKRFIRSNYVIMTPLADGYENVSDAQIETADTLVADEFVINQIYLIILKAPKCVSHTMTCREKHLAI